VWLLVQVEQPSGGSIRGRTMHHVLAGQSVILHAFLTCCSMGDAYGLACVVQRVAAWEVHMGWPVLCGDVCDVGARFWQLSAGCVCIMWRMPQQQVVESACCYACSNPSPAAVLHVTPSCQ
jgi:hypothetical protein